MISNTQAVNSCIDSSMPSVVMKPKLSICIPTYNRELFLKELLESIVAQADFSEVEIVVSDNASTDNTSELIVEFRKRYPNITYAVAPKNLGADRNYITSVELANGDYCWLMGSDDVLAPGAIAAMLRHVSSGNDIYLCGRSEATYRLGPIRDRVWLEPNEASQLFDFSERQELLRYFCACRSLGGLFSYLSSIVVKKKSWDRISLDENFIGSAYSHAYVLLSLVLQGCRLDYLTNPLVISRSGNDSFLTDWVARALIDFNGYHRLALALIPEDIMLRKAFYGVMRYEYSAINIIKTKILSPSQQWTQLAVVAQSIYGFSPWIFRLSSILYPLGRMVLLVKRKYKKLRAPSAAEILAVPPKC